MIFPYNSFVLESDDATLLASIVSLRQNASLKNV